MAQLHEQKGPGLMTNLFGTQDFDLSGDPEVQAQKAKLAEASKHDVRNGFGLSQGAVDMGTQIGERAKAGGDYGLTGGVQQAGGMMGNHSQQAFNAGLGGSQDQNLQTALQKRFNKGFAREAQGIKSKAQLEAQSLRSQDLDTAQKTMAAQQGFGEANRQIKQAQEAQNRANRSAVLGGIIGGAGAIVGTAIAPGAGTSMGAQMGSSVGGGM